jgi:hypothetical protein
MPNFILEYLPFVVGLARALVVRALVLRALAALASLAQAARRA